MEFEEESVTDYSVPVHKSLMERHMLFGIGELPFYGILVVTVILACLVSPYCILLGVAAVMVCRLLCKKEPQLLEFIIQNMSVHDVYRG